MSGILIFRHIKKKQSDNLLNILFFLTLYIYLTDLLIPSEIYRIVPFLLFTDLPALFLIPPLLLLYIRKMTGIPPLRRGRYFQALHFIPFMVVLIDHLPRILQPSREKIRMFTEGTIPPPLLLGIDITLIGLVQYLSYLMFCTFLILSFRNKCAGATGLLRKVRNILLFYLMIFIGLSASYYNLLNYKYYPQRDFSNLRLILDFPILIICVYNYFVLLSGNQPPHIDEKTMDREKYSKSALSPEENEVIFSSLCRKIESEELWSDPDLNLRSLAEMTNRTYHNLSQVINQTTGLNYHGFINRYRINEACRLLEETDMTVLDIGFTSGFNSKATFNKVFKEEKNCTPTQYRENFRKKTD